MIYSTFRGRQCDRVLVPAASASAAAAPGSESGFPPGSIRCGRGLAGPGPAGGGPASRSARTKYFPLHCSAHGVNLYFYYVFTLTANNLPKDKLSIGVVFVCLLSEGDKRSKKRCLCVKLHIQVTHEKADRDDVHAVCLAWRRSEVPTWACKCVLECV